MFTLFFVSPEELLQDVVELSGPQAHHAISVLRVEKEEVIRLGDGLGNWGEGAIKALKKNSLTVEVLHRGVDSKPKVEVVVAQAILKGDNQKAALDQLVQAGADVIIPWRAQRSIGTIDKSDKWREVMTMAARQSRRSRLAKLETVVELEQLLASRSSYDKVIALHESATERLSEIPEFALSKKVLLIVGPEGGLSNDEIEKFRAASIEPVKMGEPVVRADLAGALALAALNALTGTW